MSKKYTLIVGDRYSLSNETDNDAMTDYFPGIWGIKSKKQALKYAKELIDYGDTITVIDYNNVRYHAAANDCIKELGLKQPLFSVVKTPTSTGATNGKPKTLSDLKRYLSPTKMVNIINYDSDGAIRNQRDAVVILNQTNSVVFSKTTPSMDSPKSWLEYGKASDWTFDNNGATNHCLWSDRIGGGKYVPSTRINYLD